MKKKPRNVDGDALTHSSAIDNLLAYLQSHLTLSPKFHKTIHPMLNGETLNSKLNVVKPGEICTTAYWLERGYARYYRLIQHEDGTLENKTIDFCKPKKILVIPECFFNGHTCEYYVELSKGAVIVPLSRYYFNKLKFSVPETETLANNIISLEKLENMKKTELVKIKPRIRYEEALKLFGKEIEQFFPIKTLASFLGIHASHLSRIRGEIKK